MPRQVLKIEHSSMVPAGAVSIEGKIYLFAMNVHHWPWEGAPATVVASGALFRSDDDGKSFRKVLQWGKRGIMTNVSPVLGPHPQTKDASVVWLFSTGRFRRSPIFLGWVEPQKIEDANPCLNI